MTRTRTALLVLGLALLSCGGEVEAPPWVHGCWRGGFLGAELRMTLAPPTTGTQADAVGEVRLAGGGEQLVGRVAAFAVEPRSAVLRLDFSGYLPFLAFVYPSNPDSMTGAASGGGLEAEPFTWSRCAP